MVTIGVTGHRILAEIDKLNSAIDQVLHRLEEAFPGDWTVVSALAEGADRLVTHRLLARKGTTLLAVLPMSAQDYENDFPSAASKAEFQELLAGARGVVRVSPQRSRERSYELGGQMVLQSSDVLVAVWDGQTAQGLGGTGGIVAQARERHLPLAWVHAGNRKPSTKEPTSLGVAQGEVTFERFPRRSPSEPGSEHRDGLQRSRPGSVTHRDPAGLLDG